MKNANDNYPIDPCESIRIPNVRCAYGECPCARSRCCDIWIEYQVAMVTAHESGELLHGNWLEITRLRDYIDYLEGILEGDGVSHCGEWDFPGQPR